MEALGIHLGGLVTQIVSFLILFAVLSRLLYKPLLNALDQRSDRIRESLESAQRATEEAARSQEEMQGQLEAARAEGQAMIAQAREVADRFREEELAKARQEIQAERARAQATIQREREAAIEGAAERVRRPRHRSRGASGGAFAGPRGPPGPHRQSPGGELQHRPPLVPMGSDGIAVSSALDKPRAVAPIGPML